MFEIPTTVEIADGTYPAVVESIVSDTGNYGPFRKWSFLVEHVAADGSKKIDSISAITSGNTGPRSKTYAWLTAIIGRAPKAGEKIEDPTGTRVLVTIEHNDKGFPTVAQLTPLVEPVQVEAGIPR